MDLFPLFASIRNLDFLFPINAYFRTQKIWFYPNSYVPRSCHSICYFDASHAAWKKVYMWHYTFIRHFQWQKIMQIGFSSVCFEHVKINWTNFLNGIYIFIYLFHSSAPSKNCLLLFKPLLCTFKLPKKKTIGIYEQ